MRIAAFLWLCGNEKCLLPSQATDINQFNTLYYMNYFCQDLCRKDPFSYEVSCAKVQQLFHISFISPNIFLSDVSDPLTMSYVSHAFFVPLCREQCRKTFVRLS